MKLKDFLQWGEQALALERFALAEEIARYPLAQSPHNLAARTLLGHVSLAAGRYEQAADHFSQALDMDPENPRTLTSYADALEAQGRDEETLDALRRAFECEPARTEVKQRVVALQGAEDGASAGEALLTRTGLARIHLRSGLIEHAIAELCQLLEERQVHWSAHVALMEAHWLNGDRQAAGGLADEIVRAHPNCLKAILLSADVRAHLGLMDQARQFFERSRQVDPDFVLARALYPANGPSRLPLPSDDAEISVPLDFLQRIEAELAATRAPEPERAAERAPAAREAAAAAETPRDSPLPAVTQAASGAEAGQPDAPRVIVTPAPRAEEAVAADTPATHAVTETEDVEAAAAPAAQPDADTAAVADAEFGLETESAVDAKPDEDTWEELLAALERQADGAGAAAPDSIAERLEALAESTPDKLQAWQQLGDVYQRLGKTDRAMRAYMKALESGGGRVSDQD